ncbi:hypothetical protein [Roseinatronobacter sp.]|uniref:hypothetical protein n=1 Tax=Roseinatronobacter sp. TaxID=1945755 RepID=UPI0025E67193|nr:hypothetical protein [Roseibaca sp.]
MKTVYVNLKEGDALLVIEGTPVEFEALVQAMAVIEGALEQNGKTEALDAFHLAGEMIARARVVEYQPANPDSPEEQRRKNTERANAGLMRAFGRKPNGGFSA